MNSTLGSSPSRSFSCVFQKCRVSKAADARTSPRHWRVDEGVSPSVALACVCVWKATKPQRQAGSGLRSPQTAWATLSSAPHSSAPRAGDKLRGTRSLLAGSTGPWGAGLGEGKCGAGTGRDGARWRWEGLLQPCAPLAVYPHTCLSQGLSLPFCTAWGGGQQTSPFPGTSCPNVPWPELGSPLCQAQGGLRAEKEKRKQACEGPGLRAVT